MIKSISIKNFKSHKTTELNFSNLTVLCGSNGVGKSSIIHALLLLRDAYLNKSNFDYIDLKSKYISIGTAKDALYQYSDSNEIIFEINTDECPYKYSFNVEHDSDLTRTLICKSKNIQHISDKNILETESLFNKSCQFISAARLGPQLSYNKDDVVVEIHNQISVLEGRAEHFVHFLYSNKNKNVLDDLVNHNSKDKDLYSQVTAWEREISSGINVIIEDKSDLGYELKYSFNTETSSGKTDEFKASNVGFGITYVMPVIVAILSAPIGALLLIENPEAHLHPNGQAKLIELICLAAQAGVQIVLETHSDHIINGILVQCKKFEESQNGISKNNVSIYHFDRNVAEQCSEAKKINIEDNGRIRYTPKGFFDQFTIDRKFLMGF
jgi:predicted ATPase